MVNIVMDVLSKNPLASFMYIGAADKKDVANKPTRRYRVYSMYMAEFDISDIFMPADFPKQSMMLFINKQAMPTPSQQRSFANSISDFIGSTG